jgi:HAD superfamily hydrolase (TIGR01509 family)
MNNTSTAWRRRDSAWLTASFDAVLFDFNGTLADDETVIARLIDDILRRNGYPPLPPQRYDDELVGRTDHEIFELIIGADHPDLHLLVEELIHDYQAATNDADPISRETVELVRRLKTAGLPLGVVTGAYRMPVMHALNRSMIVDCFDIVVTADETRWGKPHPEGYLRAMRSLALTHADRVLVFEDSDVGVAAASAAGMRCVRVRHGGSRNWERHPVLNGLGVKTLSDLRAILGQD